MSAIASTEVAGAERRSHSSRQAASGQDYEQIGAAYRQAECWLRNHRMR